jgi:hypothetical protein
MDKVIAVKNFVGFAIPLSALLVCKMILPNSMYESIVNYTADKFFMPPPNNRGMCNMYEKSLNPRTFLMWTTSNLNAVKSTFSSMMLEMGCTAHVGSKIDEEIEFIEYSTLAPKKLSDFRIPEDEQTPLLAIEDSKPIVLNIGSTS